jgi:4-alpha-glucanotransferase
MLKFHFIFVTAFGGGSDNPHLPHNHELDQVVYTGTHDNDTVSSSYFKRLFSFKSILGLVNK